MFEKVQYWTLQCRLYIMSSQLLILLSINDDLIAWYKSTKIYIWRYGKEKSSILMLSLDSFAPKCHLLTDGHKIFDRFDGSNISHFCGRDLRNCIHVSYVYLEQCFTWSFKKAEAKLEIHLLCAEVSTAYGAARQESRGMAEGRGGGVSQIIRHQIIVCKFYFQSLGAWGDLHICVDYSRLALLGCNGPIGSGFNHNFVLCINLK